MNRVNVWVWVLPNFLEITNPYPGEPRFLRKRRHPKSLRFFKAKRDREPERFFLHELMMYKSFNSEDYERWHESTHYHNVFLAPSGGDTCHKKVPL